MIDLIANPEEILLQEEPHRYLRGGKSYISVTGIKDAAGFGDDFSHVPKRIMERAQRRGEYVHMACQYIDENDFDPSTIDESIMGYVDAYLKFRSECPIKLIATEQKMVCPSLGLGGTPDLVCFLRGRRVVIDRKTCQRLGKALGLQTVGYKLLWETTHRGQIIYERYGLRLQPDGNYKLIPCEDPDDLPAFWDMLNFTKAKERRDRWLTKYGK